MRNLIAIVLGVGYVGYCVVVWQSTGQSWIRTISRIPSCIVAVAMTLHLMHGMTRDEMLKAVTFVLFAPALTALLLGLGYAADKRWLDVTGSSALDPAVLFVAHVAIGLLGLFLAPLVVGSLRKQKGISVPASHRKVPLVMGIMAAYTGALTSLASLPLSLPDT